MKVFVRYRKRGLLLALLCLQVALFASSPSTSSFTPSSAGIVFFEGTIADGLSKARAEGKMLFIDCYTPTCVPCKKLELNVFTNPEVGRVYNKDFVCMKVNLMDSQYDEFSMEFQIFQAPTLVYFDQEGRMVYKEVGGTNTIDFIGYAQRAKAKTADKEFSWQKKEVIPPSTDDTTYIDVDINKQPEEGKGDLVRGEHKGFKRFNPAENTNEHIFKNRIQYHRNDRTASADRNMSDSYFEGAIVTHEPYDLEQDKMRITRMENLQLRFDRGEHLSSEELYELAYSSRRYQRDFNAVVDKYLADKDPNDPTLAVFNFDFATNVENSAFKNLFTRQSTYKSLGYNVDERMELALRSSTFNAIKLTEESTIDKAGERLFQDVIWYITNSEFIGKRDLLFRLYIMYYEGTDSWDEYMDFNMKFMSTHEPRDADLLSDVAKTFAEKTTQRTELKAALTWIREACNLESTYTNTFWKAKLHQALGEYDKCRYVLINEAIPAARREQISLVEINTLLDYLNAGY